MERRTFMKAGLAVGVVAAGGLTALALRPGDKAVRPARPLFVLEDAVFPVMAAVAARVMRGTSASPIEIAHRVDEALRFAPPRSQRDLNLVLKLLENALGGVLLRASATPFTLLDETSQDAALSAWRDSAIVDLRGGYHALRKLCLAAHYASSDCFAELAYPGPSIAKPVPPPIAARAPLLVTESSGTDGMP